MPVENAEPWVGQSEFLAKLNLVEEMAKRTAYRGLSLCRCCRAINGSVTYEHGGWEWPSGFRHYVDAHNVRPTDEFIEFVKKA